MILTGKAKQDFENWLRDYYEVNREDYNKYPFPVILKKYYRKTDIEKNALIIEWFDSVGIYIVPFKQDVIKKLNFSCDIITENGLFNNFNEWFLTRQEATTKAIEKANEIYNDTKK